MLDFRQLAPKVAEQFFFSLWDRQRADEPHFQGLRSWHRRLVTQDFLILQRHFRVLSFGVSKNHRPLVFGQVFIPLNLAHSPSVGNLVADAELTADEAQFFWESLKDRLLKVAPQLSLEKLIIGMNGHMDLGISVPSTSSTESSFLTTSPARFQAVLFGGLKPLRILKALKTKIDRALIEKVRTDLRNPPEGFATREIRFWNFRREIAIYSQLVRRSMHDHPLYWPLDDDEVYDCMKELRWILPARYFQFLLHREREIGFCFAIPDYNEVLGGTLSDWSVMTKLVLQRRKVHRARIVYSAIVPEYRGRKIFHLVRHSVIGAMIDDGVGEFESSYIDAVNTNSLKNAESTFGQEHREFYVYGFSGIGGKSFS